MTSVAYTGLTAHARRRDYLCGMRLLLIVLASCSIDPPAPQAPHLGPAVLTVVDEAGHPVAGARVDWQQISHFACDVDTPIAPTYWWGGTASTDAAGRFMVPSQGQFVRVVAPDGAAAVAHIDGDTTLVVRPTVTVAIAPRCPGGCAAIEGFGTISVGVFHCKLAPEVSDYVGSRLQLSRVPRGELELELRSGPNTDDERAVKLHATITGDATLTPELPRIAGSLAVRGRMLIDDRPPGGPDYASHVRVDCGPLLGRDVTPAPDGRFTVEHLPARACTVHATSDRDLRYRRDVMVQPGGPELIVELTPATSW